MGPVIDAHAAPLGGALFQVVNTHPFPATDNMRGIYPQAPQGVYRPLPDGMGGKPGHKGCVHSIIC